MSVVGPREGILRGAVAEQKGRGAIASHATFTQSLSTDIVENNFRESPCWPPSKRVVFRELLHHATIEKLLRR